MAVWWRVNGVSCVFGGVAFAARERIVNAQPVCRLGVLSCAIRSCAGSFIPPAGGEARG